MTSFRISRRKLADFYADQLLSGKKDVANQLAAYLIETNRLREVELITRDIEAALATRGVVVADVATAHELTPATRDAIEAYLKHATKASSVQMKVSVEPELLGGLRLKVPGSEMDATLQRKIMKLRAAKV